VLYVVASLVMNPSPIVQPSWPYNVDSAIYYIIFFAVGYFVFPYLHRLLTAPGAVMRILRGTLACVTGAYAVLVFFGRDPLNAWRFQPALSLAHGLLQPLALIYLTLYLSRLLTHVKLFLAMGRDTLYLCGAEYLIKLLIPSLLSIVGLNVAIPHPIAAYVYTMVCLAASHYLLTPVLKGALKRLGCG